MTASRDSYRRRDGGPPVKLSFYHLTEAGLRLWEEERDPDWARYVDVQYEGEREDGWEAVLVRAVSPETARAYLEHAFGSASAARATPVRVEGSSKAEGNWFPAVPQLRLAAGDLSPGEGRPWSLDERESAWWSRSTNLLTGPPMRWIRLPPGAGDAELAGEVRAAAAGPVRVWGIDLPGGPGGAGVTGAGLGLLAGLRIVSLSVTGAPVADDGLEAVGRMRGLDHLRLRDLPVTDAGLRSLSALEGLRTLDLAGTAITGDGLAALPPLRHPRRLDLSRTRTGADALRHVARLGVVSLDLSRTAVTDEGLEAHLERISFYKLRLDGTAIGDRGLARLAERSIGALGLDGTRVTDAGLRALLRGPIIAILKTLSLAGTAVTDDGLEAIGELHALRRVDLSGTRVTAAGIEGLRLAAPGLAVRWTGPGR